MEHADMDIKKRTALSLSELIELVKNKQDRSTRYAIYGVDSGKMLANAKYYLDDPVFVNDDDEEVFPKFVVDNGLDLIYSSERFQDVVDLAYRQKPSASVDEIIAALNYYDDNDDFLDLR
jgi:hypothetical protein